MAATTRLLVLTPFRNRERFCSLQAGRVLLDALEQRKIQITLHQPWHPVDLDTFDVVLCWTYRHTWRNFLFYCKELEEQCDERGLPVLNSANRYTNKHSKDLARWHEAGLPCARFQRFRRLTDVTLPFPLILRRDGLHQARGMVRVENAKEAAEAAEAYRREVPSRPLDMAIQFLDSRWPDGFYRKRRCYVVGDQVIPAHALRSEHWIVNFGSVSGTAASFREHRSFLESQEPLAPLLQEACRIAQADWAAVDYSPTSDGQGILWEANRNPRMWGDEGYPAGRPRESEELYGLAIADLVIARAEGHGPTPGSSTTIKP